jgi:N-carbamoyl-L-amino-acid hydrolase
MVSAQPARILAAVMAKREFAAELFDQLRSDGLDEPGVTRDPYGEGEQRGHATVRSAGKQLGLAIDQDDAANLYMTWRGQNRSAPRVMIGSHIDSVPHGGNFDGAAGVVAGLVAISALQALGQTPRPPVTVMGIRAEESIWFEVSYIGSRGALGALPDGAMQASRRDTGRSLAEHIDACGGRSSALSSGRGYLNPKEIAAFLELHIEQAPSLVAAGLPVGICTGIPGNFRYPNAVIYGQHDHVGLPRRFRRDAAVAAAELAMRLDAIWEDYESRGIPMAFTLGRFHTDPALHGMTIVPGAFHFSLDVRAYDPRVLESLEQEFSTLVTGIEQRRGVRFELGAKAQAAVGRMSPGIKAGLERSATELGMRWMELGSPASHDAAAFAAAGVPTGMVFIRNENGSHNPHEAMEIDDFLAGTAVLANWLASSVA